MKQIGMLFFRNSTLLVLVLLVLAICVPNNQTVMAAAVTSDDFNRCAIDTSFWKVATPAEGAADGHPVITGQYTGDSSLSMSVPAGASYRFSDNGMEAPRIWHSISDGNIYYEVKFMAPLSELTAYNWKINGVLVRDNTQTPARYFRFEYDTTAGALNRYAAYLNGAGDLTHIVSSTGPTDLPGTNPAGGPLYLRIKYEKATTLWTITWQVGTSGTNLAVSTFKGSDYDAAFTLTDIGLFLGSTGLNPPGATMTVDYVRDMNDTAFVDDNTILTVQKLGNGTVNWPLLNPNQCSNGNQVTLTATPLSGSAFAGWGGAVPFSTHPITTVTMDSSKTVTATFNFRILLPHVSSSQ